MNSIDEKLPHARELAFRPSMALICLIDYLLILFIVLTAALSASVIFTNDFRTPASNTGSTVSNP